ncbi:MAG: hypothetical protein JRD89_16695 [Deltaproteobacteria bacterium]|nr:hypothetical protein [Deltaproteobacteria bacterium]
MTEKSKPIRMQPWTSLDELGNPIDSKRITFLYPDGTAGKIEIPNRELSAERVKQRIDEEIALWREIMGL